MITHLYSGTTLTGAVIDHNCYNEYPSMIGYGVIAYDTVADFNAATAFESGGCGGNVGMAGPAAGNFTLLGSSVCATIGSPSAGIAVDYSGYPFAVPPSSGAYQFR